MEKQITEQLLNCPKCGKRLVHPDDWGDYDDACEWGCEGCHTEDHDEAFWTHFWDLEEVGVY